MRISNQRRKKRAVLTILALLLLFLAAAPAPAQEPPEIPLEELVQRFAEKESVYATAHSGYDYKMTVRVRELDKDDEVVGSFEQEGQVTFGRGGVRVLTMASNPHSDLTRLGLQRIDLGDLRRFPLFLIRPEEIEKYDVTYLTSERIDEVNTHLFRLRPKGVPHYPEEFFEGVVWVDARQFDIVRAQGRMVPAHTTGALGGRFQRFELFREPVDDYLFSTFFRSEEILTVRRGEELRARLIIRFTGHERIRSRDKNKEKNKEKDKEKIPEQTGGPGDAGEIEDAEDPPVPEEEESGPPQRPWH